MNPTLPHLLILGGPDSGKSTFRAQLYQRVEFQSGELSLVASVGNMSALQGDVDRLVEGLQPMHTHFETYNRATMVVGDKQGRQYALDFADYGGEQIQRIGELNGVSVPWIERARNASSWLFFLRIDQIRHSKSFMTDPVEVSSQSVSEAEDSYPKANGELNAIEILQRLLFVRGASLRSRLNEPRLGVFLSCWDELSEVERSSNPESILQTRAPLFFQFVKSNWSADAMKIWGLSSTEKPLPKDKPDLEFARKGAANAGYIVTNESCSPDLTLPVAWLMSR